MAYYPLSDSFMAVSMLGFIASIILTFKERIPFSWGVAMTVLFAAFVVAALISARASASK